MIACVSPHYAAYDETLNTLKYAQRAKLIKGELTQNYLVAPEGSISFSVVHWDGMPADHSLVSYTMHSQVCAPMQSKKSHWTCVHEADCLQDAASQSNWFSGGVSEFIPLVQDFQAKWADFRTCSERRAERLPAHPAQSMSECRLA